jgi:glycosyltransferase involved in cell wall biosynthesis
LSSEGGLLVSIITPTLGRATMLEGTLRSVQGQSYPNVEHIVVDGGSTDGTIELLRRYEGSYNLRWTTGPDRGMYDAINKGLALARGDVVAYLNSDDRYFPWTVAVALDAFAEHPKADLVYGDVIRVDEILGRVVPIFVPPLNAGAMAAFGTLSQPAVLMHRRVLDALHGFDDELRYVADLDFWLRAASRFEFQRVSEVLALEFRHAEMLSEASKDRMSSEDETMRARYRRGAARTALGTFAAYLRWHWWAGWLWVAFGLATRGGRHGWKEIIRACGPRLSPRDLAIGWLPSKGSRLRAGVQWRSQPLAVAEGEHVGDPAE